MTLAVPLMSASGTGDLSGYTDHLRNAAVVELAWSHGLDVYREPYGTLLQRTPLARAPREWMEVGYLYPPGALVFFAPVAAIGRFIRDDARFARVCLVYLLLWTHLAIFASWRVLATAPGRLRFVAGVLVWALLVHAGLCGQYDAVWVVGAACAARALRLERYPQALLWVAAAALLHQRAVVLAPMGVVALIAILRRPGGGWSPGGQLPWLRLTGSAACVLLALTFSLFAARWEGAARNVAPLLESPSSPWTLAAIGLTGAAGALLAWQRQWALVGAVAIVGAVALIDSRHWWHAIIAIPPLLLTFAARPGASAPVQAGMLVWFVGMQRVFGERPLELFKQLAAFLR